MKRILLSFLCFIMFFVSLPQNYVSAAQQFKRPSFQNGGIMSLEIDDFSYYYKDKDAENYDEQPNNTLIRFDYYSGERLYLADNVVYFISGVTGDNQIWKTNFPVG